jgi:uncharacterized protein YbjT (DUF2867 family)
MRIVVTTPTGQIGSKLADILLDRRAQVTVIARNPEKVKELAARGAKIIQGEHGDSDVLDKALEDATALFWLSPPLYKSHDPLGDAKSMAEAGAKAISKRPDLHVVLTSSVGAHLPTGTGPIAGLHAIEELFRATAKNFTSLRANFLMENTLGSLPTILSDDAIYSLVPGATKVPQLATHDVAEVAAEYLQSPPNGHHVVDIVGPRDLSFDEAAAILSRTIGRQVRAVTVPGEALKQGLLQAGFSKEVADLFVEMQTALAAGLAHELRGETKRVGKVTFEHFAKEVFLPAYQNASKMAQAG